MFKDMYGFESFLQVSKSGLVKNKKTGTILKTQLSKGYHQLVTRITGEQRTIKVHRAVAMTFIPNPENKPFVNHKSGNKLNNQCYNLEWNTCSENTKHAWDKGLIKRKRK